VALGEREKKLCRMYTFRQSDPTQKIAKDVQAERCARTTHFGARASVRLHFCAPVNVDAVISPNPKNASESAEGR